MYIQYMYMCYVHANYSFKLYLYKNMNVKQAGRVCGLCAGLGARS